MQYGLIGEKLGHSFSKEIHEKINNYQYELKELNKDEFKTFMEEKNFKAINVTIPYKEKVIPYLDYIDKFAKELGVVNTIVNKNQKLYGYNTDFLGLRDLVLTNNINPSNKKILILGDGATAKTAYAVFKSLNAKKIIFVSLNPQNDAISYQEALKHLDTNIIINATPCGMYPNNDDLILDITNFINLEAVIDVIYNPLNTALLRSAKKMHIKALSGLYMLVAQAVYASCIFTDQQEKDVNKIICEIYKKIKNEKENIVLIGMPSSGKTTIGKILCKKLNKEFVDTDQKIEEIIKMPIANYLNQQNEKEFRKIEKDVIKTISKQNNQVISTGGGIILDEENIWHLQANGKIIFLDRPLELLTPTSSRPLANDFNKITRLFNERINLYQKYADLIIKNDQSIDEVINKILMEV